MVEHEEQKKKKKNWGHSPKLQKVYKKFRFTSQANVHKKFIDCSGSRTSRQKVHKSMNFVHNMATLNCLFIKSIKMLLILLRKSTAHANYCWTTLSYSVINAVAMQEGDISVSIFWARYVRPISRSVTKKINEKKFPSVMHYSLVPRPHPLRCLLSCPDHRLHAVVKEDMSTSVCMACSVYTTALLLKVCR